MPPGDLTTLANVKEWRSPPITAEVGDGQLSRVITAISKAIVNYLQRSALYPANYTEVRNGEGTQGMMLYRGPILSVSAVSVDGTSIVVAPSPTANGWVYDSERQMLYLRGRCFDRGFQNVSVTYRAGFQVTDEPQTVANLGSVYVVPCSSLLSYWISDVGVEYADGTPLVKVTSSPLVGQYIAPTNQSENYTFNQADNNAQLLISYGYSPDDIVQAATELVILRVNERARLGDLSKTLAGEVVEYEKGPMPASVVSYLQQYMIVVPIT